MRLSTGFNRPKLFLILLLAIVSHWGTSSAAEEESLASTFFSGLLDTLTSTADSKDCPGVCVHTIATLICYEVLEEVTCPSPSMRCCVDQPGASANSSTSTTPAPSSTTSPSTTTTHTQPSKKKPPQSTAPSSTSKPHNTTSGSSKPSKKPQGDSDGAQTKDKCVGVCVAEKIADYCEAVLNDASLCKSGLRCCVSKETFPEDEIPDNLVIMNRNTSHSQLKTTPLPSTTTTTTSTTTTTQRPASSTSSTGSQSGVIRPLHKKPCKGECVNGLFALFCDDVDTDATCPADERCCVTNPVSSPTQGPRPSTTTTPAPPPPLPRCPGFCLPSLMSALCERPSVLVQRTSTCRSDRGSVCCDNTRAASNSSPSRQPPRTTTTSTPPPPRDDRPDCPGSCIVTYLSFTCFRNAEMTELFKCRKQGTQCCAPKSIIREKLGTSSPSHSQPGHNIAADLDAGGSNHLGLGGLGGLGGPQTKYGIQHTAAARNDTVYSTLPPYRPSQPMAPLPPPRITGIISEVFGVGQTAPPVAVPPVPQLPQLPQLPPQLSPQLPPQLSPQLPPSTTTMRSPVYSKYVCGVKGTARERTARANHLSVSRPPVVGAPRTATGIEGRVPQMFASNASLWASGAGRKGRVVGGEDAEPGEWCWQVALINSLNQYLCGGALIGTQWVLTAAHCVTNIVRSGDAIYVRVGDHDLTRKYGSVGAQTLRVATTYIHHNHNSQTLDNDVALLKLHGQAELGSSVCLVCLPARGVQQTAGKRCTVTGYGYQGEDGPIPLRIREADIPIVSETECVRKINAVTEKIFILPTSTFCAGGELGNDACQGDGGGPLVCQDDGFYELVGLVSWGFGCGRFDVPGVYVKVATFIGWINQIISVNNL